MEDQRSREALNRVCEVFEELNFPSADRLLRPLKQRGIPAQAKDVKALVQEESSGRCKRPRHC